MNSVKSKEAAIRISELMFKIDDLNLQHPKKKA
jgi:hypothetical protein